MPGELVASSKQSLLMAFLADNPSDDLLVVAHCSRIAWDRCIRTGVSQRICGTFSLTPCHWAAILRFTVKKQIPINQPNQFKLKGSDDTHVNYSISGAGERTLIVNGNSHSGDLIKTEKLPIGTLVTVTTLLSDRRGCSRQFSVLLPRFRGDEVHEFTTFGIFTDDCEFEVGTPDGVLTTYRTIELKGTARTAHP